MINFASLFNQFRMGSSIGDLIDAPGVTIDRLLDEDSFLNEFKSGTTKVQQFMKYDKFKTLVKYVTEVGPAEDRKRSYKFKISEIFRYPLSACDLLSSDNNLTSEYFFTDSPIIIREKIEETPASTNDKQEPETKEDQAAPEVEKESEEASKVVIEDKLDTPEKAQGGTSPDEESNTKEKEESQEAGNASEEEKEAQIKYTEKEVEPLQIDLFSYFEGEINYTLAGYVSKIFTTFHTKKPQAVSKFLLEPKRFSNLLNHIESRSVGDLVVKLLTHESTDALELRKAAFEQILNKVEKNNEVYLLSNLATSICEIIEKVATNVKNANENSVELSQIYFTPQIITQIISNVMSEEENVSVYNAPILQTYLINVPLVIPEESQVVVDLKNLLLSFLNKTLEKLRVERGSRKTLGFGRMKIVEIMSFVLKENVLNTRDLAASETEFFSILFNLCKNYQYNNVLHNEVVRIVEIALNEEENSPFLALLLRDDILLNFLVSETEEDQKIKSGSGSQKCRKGYIGHIVSICRKIQEAAEKNETVNKFASSIDKIYLGKEFERIIEELVNKEVYEYNKSLAGYSMKRGNKHPVLFVKEDVINEHIKFLTSTPPPVYETEAEHINIEHPDLVEAEKIQAEEAEDEAKQINDTINEEVGFVPQFFEVHLKYNVDDLMNDL